MLRLVASPAYRYIVSLSNPLCHTASTAYTTKVPKLWTDTIEAHRKTVREATMDATAALVAQHGLRAVTMSQVAEATGIGRATLYKYFPDVDAILAAWHQREIAGHLQQLVDARDRATSPIERLEAVLTTYATIAHDSHGHHDRELAALLHRDERVDQAEHDLRAMVRVLIADAATSGELRDDVPPGELATFCLHAITAAGSLASAAAVRRLVGVTLSGLRSPP